MTDTTPLPWRIAGENAPECWQIETEDGDFIAQCEDRRQFASLDAVANARYIVQAANAHPRLVEALRDCLAVLTDPIVGTIYHDDPDWYQALDRAVAKARAALSEVSHG